MNSWRRNTAVLTVYFDELKGASTDERWRLLLLAEATIKSPAGPPEASVRSYDASNS